MYADVHALCNCPSPHIHTTAAPQLHVLLYYGDGATSQIASVPEAHTYNTFLFAANVTWACMDPIYYKTVLARNSPERVERSLPVEK